MKPLRISRKQDRLRKKSIHNKLYQPLQKMMYVTNTDETSTIKPTNFPHLYYMGQKLAIIFCNMNLKGEKKKKSLNTSINMLHTTFFFSVDFLLVNASKLESIICFDPCFNCVSSFNHIIEAFKFHTQLQE